VCACLGEIIFNLTIDIPDGAEKSFGTHWVNRSTAVGFRGPCALFKQCSLRGDQIEIHVPCGVADFRSGMGRLFKNQEVSGDVLKLSGLRGRLPTIEMKKDMARGEGIWFQRDEK
jgi:hypothetical protein